MLNMDKNDTQDDIEITPEGDQNNDLELEEQEANEQTKIKSLRAKLKACEEEKKQQLDDLQRTKADFLNSKKRLQDEVVRAKERAVEDQIEKLLPMCDSFAMAMGNEAVWQSVDENWRKGIEAIHTQLQSILKGYDVTVIDPKGEHFDPMRHEALGSEENEAESETVLTVIQQGYERNGTVIRPAKVIISE